MLKGALLNLVVGRFGEYLKGEPVEVRLAAIRRDIGLVAAALAAVDLGVAAIGHSPSAIGCFAFHALFTLRMVRDYSRFSAVLREDEVRHTMES